MEKIIKGEVAFTSEKGIAIKYIDSIIFDYDKESKETWVKVCLVLEGEFKFKVFGLRTSDKESYKELKQLYKDVEECPVANFSKTQNFLGDMLYQEFLMIPEDELTEGVLPDVTDRKFRNPPVIKLAS